MAPLAAAAAALWCGGAAVSYPQAAGPPPAGAPSGRARNGPYACVCAWLWHQPRPFTLVFPSAAPPCAAPHAALCLIRPLQNLGMHVSRWRRRRHSPHTAPRARCPYPIGACAHALHHAASNPNSMQQQQPRLGVAAYCCLDCLSDGCRGRQGWFKSRHPCALRLLCFAVRVVAWAFTERVSCPAACAAATGCRSAVACWRGAVLRTAQRRHQRVGFGVFQLPERTGQLLISAFACLELSGWWCAVVCRIQAFSTTFYLTQSGRARAHACWPIPALLDTLYDCIHHRQTGLGGDHACRC